MALPETIPVKYTEEEAEYLSVRPVRRQTFRLDELLDMVLGITGKDLFRIQQILRSGTLVYHFYRYWWPAFEAGAQELGEVLARFPDADPQRVYRAEECTAVLLESGGHPARDQIELTREACSRRRLFCSGSFWDCLTRLAEDQVPIYQGYSYSRHADLFQAAVTPEQIEKLRRDAARLAPREVRALLAHLRTAIRIVFVCPRAR